MKTVKYILVNENACQNAARLVRDSFVSDLRYCIVVDAIPGQARNEGVERARNEGVERARNEGTNGHHGTEPSSRAATRNLIDRLVRLRRHHPDAKILGLSELGPHCVRPSEAMNALRRELSDWP